MKKNSDKELHSNILQALTQSSRPMTIGGLKAAAHISSSTRTLQRLLNSLLEEKLIYKVGSGPATRYQLINISTITPDIQSKDRTYVEHIKLTDNSKKIIDYIAQPLTYRRPVSYNRVLLDNYIPNRTFYLDEATRALLHQIGKTTDETKMAGTYAREILHRLLIDLSWASSRLEGNTYSRIDTQNLIDYDHYAEGKDAIEAQMILNHKQAITFLIENIEDIGFNRYTLLNLHGLLSEALLHDPNDSGILRYKVVDIGGSAYKPSAIPHLINECFTIILEKAEIIIDPFEQLFFIMVHVPYLQAFVDVNKRVSRLAANIPLLKNNLCPLTFIGLSEQAYVDANLGVYELHDYSLLRDVFVWTYERSAQEYTSVQKSMVAPDPVRLKYREHIHTLIHDIVTASNSDYLERVRQYAIEQVSEGERKKFEFLVLEDLRNLRDGVLARYNITIEQFLTWSKNNV